MAFFILYTYTLYTQPVDVVIWICSMRLMHASEEVDVMTSQFYSSSLTP